MHFEASHDFSDWLFKLFCSVALKTALGSFIDIFQSKLHQQHQPKLFSTSFSVENICQIKNYAKLYIVILIAVVCFFYLLHARK